MDGSSFAQRLQSGKEMMKMLKRKGFVIIACLLIAVLFVACGSADETNKEETRPESVKMTNDKKSESDTSAEKADEGQDTSSSKVLVVYFSRTGEQYNVGVIEKGNTAIVADMIIDAIGADSFEILPETDYYPYTYAELTDVAKKEQNENARPAIKDALPDMSQYDTVFIGAPVWWGDWPMIVYTFFESADLSGKNLIPFSTHEGSGLSGFDKKLSSAVSDANVLTGLAIRGNDCQNDKTGVKSKVDKWLSELGY